MAIVCKQLGDDWLVTLDYFRLKLSKSQIGVSSFAYLKSGDWHEVVNASAVGILYFPRLSVSGLSGGDIYPYHTGSITAEFTKGAFARFKISGYLSNPTQGSSYTDFSFETIYSIYEDGDIHVKTQISLDGGSSESVTEEHILDPTDDADITLARDTVPNLWFAGFYANNTGNGTSDLSHDGVLIQFGSDFTTYVTYTSGALNQVGLGKSQTTWNAVSSRTSYFRLHLSADGSDSDITDSTSFQTVGDDKGADFQNPDPLTGGTDEGDVLTGTLSGDGFDETEGAYTFTKA